MPQPTGQDDVAVLGDWPCHTADLHDMELIAREYKPPPRFRWFPCSGRFAAG
jgi:hypothetical protein